MCDLIFITSKYTSRYFFYPSYSILHNTNYTINWMYIILNVKIFNTMSINGTTKFPKFV